MRLELTDIFFYFISIYQLILFYSICFWSFFFSRVLLLPYGTDLSRLIFQEGGEDVKEPMRIVYNDVESSNVYSKNFNGNLFQYKEKNVKLDDGLPEKNSEFIFSGHVL